jgi:hypothetical protein
MGYRADQAYEEKQQESFRDWKASLTWAEYWSWQWDRHHHFLGGAIAGGVVMLVIWWLTR